MKKEDILLSKYGRSIENIQKPIDPPGIKKLPD